MKGEINNNTTIVGDFNTSLTPTLRDGMGREVGAELGRWGTHVHPWLIHVNV